MDDESLVPTMPAMNDPEEVEEQFLDEAIQEEKKLAQAYTHGAWSAVEQYIDERIDSYRDVSTVPPNLPADEYKAMALGRVFAMNELINLMDRIKHAVEAVEPLQKKAKNGR